MRGGGYFVLGRICTVQHWTMAQKSAMERSEMREICDQEKRREKNIFYVRGWIASKVEGERSLGRLKGKNERDGEVEDGMAEEEWECVRSRCPGLGWAGPGWFGCVCGWEKVPT
jgi:hypothetical protein